VVVEEPPLAWFVGDEGMAGGCGADVCRASCFTC
jgi:hypothetical protein